MLPVRAHLELRLVLGGVAAVPVAATLRYDADEPYAVDAVFHTQDGDVTWVFGRDLLQAGLRVPSGEGDVAVWPSTHEGRPVLSISLASPSGSALLEAEMDGVTRFLDQTYELVPAGTESTLIDLDAELVQLLNDDASPHF